jgi:glycerol-3-phosphate acyltransferase PlsY
LIAVAVALVTIFWGGGFLGESFYYNVGFLQFNIDQPLWVIIILALVVWKHRGNIARLAKGEEKKLSFGGKSKAKEKEGAET